LFAGLSPKQRVLLTHGDSVTERTVADGFKVVARSGNFVAGIASEERKMYGVQFHPEVDLTLHGREMFESFLFKVVGCKGDFTMDNRENLCINEIRSMVGDKKVLVCFLGGAFRDFLDTLDCRRAVEKSSLERGRERGRDRMHS
uniref:Glutamine amidotransferase type-1 domain-containing protein n=1 Tax=Toxocara canis TaxID=6265 RepID=A0A183U5Q7_TOXCA